MHEFIFLLIDDSLVDSFKSYLFKTLIACNTVGYVGQNTLGPDLSNVPTIFQKKTVQIWFQYWIKCTKKKLF